MTDHLAQALRRDEGLRLKAYPDPLSPLAKELAKPVAQRVQGWTRLPGAPWTIGYGHTGPEVYPGLVWTEAQCIAALNEDIREHNEVLAKAIPWIANLDAPRREVLQNMHFNMGWDNPRTPKLEGLAGFTNTLAKIKAGDYDGAADNMEQSLWYRQTGGRARRLVTQMRTGVRQ